MRGLITQQDYRRNPTLYLFVNGIRYSNSAAKFWPALVDEAKLFYPQTYKVIVRGTSPGQLEEQQLFPEVWLKKDLEKLLRHDLEEMMRQAAAELELTGPPSSVTVGLFTENDENILLTQLPEDTMDAELLPFFLVWLLRWATVDQEKWNNEFVEGSFKADDTFNDRVYNFSFTIHNRYLAEGLYDRTCTLFP